jgi:hypothetical protein
MEGECSHVIKEVGAPNVTEVPHPEELVVSSSSGDSSSSGSKSDAAAQEEGSEAVDPCESSGSYVFGPSTVMFSLGGAELRRCANQQGFHEVLRSALSTEEGGK